MKHLYLATPSYGNATCKGYVQSIALTVAECTRAKIVLSGPSFQGGPYVEVNRNRLAHQFLYQSDADTILFLDDDVTWDERAVVRLYESPYDIVGGAYPKKQDRRNYPVNLLDNWQGRYCEAIFLPGGFMMIRRRVLEALIGTVPTDEGGSFADTTVNVFFHNIYSPKFCGEDVQFCNYARMAGFKVWCDLDIDFAHQGPHEWSGNLLRDLRQEGKVEIPK